METAPDELAQVLLRVVAVLPPETHALVLRDLPTPELARLACVHPAFRDAWRDLQVQEPGRHAPPTAAEVEVMGSLSRLERAAAYGDVAVIHSMVAAGVDEHGAPLLQALAAVGARVVDKALSLAAGNGRVQAVELLLGAGADLQASHNAAVRAASKTGRMGVVKLLLERGAKCRCRDGNGVCRRSPGHCAAPHPARRRCALAG